MPETFTVILLILALNPLAYYLIAIFSSWRYFSRQPPSDPPDISFAPPVSILKPVKGIDPDAYENFASFCRQDYPDYELVFCVDREDAPVMEAIRRLQRDFPERTIRVLFGSGRAGANDKAAKLARLVSEAEHEVLAITDSDVRVQPNYLKTVVRPLANPEIGAVTLPYVPVCEKTFADELQSIGMCSDFFPGIFVARQLDGVKFALGPTIVTTRSQLAHFGGYEAIENRPADDLLVGRSIAEQGYRVELVNYPVETVADFDSLRELLYKRLRWMIVTRHMRPWGHFGLLLTQGLPWSLLAAIVSGSAVVAATYLGLYLALRTLMTWVVGVYGLGQRQIVGRLFLIPVWDAIAFVIWVVSFTRSSVRWRGNRYQLRGGQIVSVSVAK